MAIGERIKFFRTIKGWTQKELGVKLGFSERTADVRVAQYESEKRLPKDQMITTLAYLLDVDALALKVPDIDTDYGLMHTLFALEDRYGLTVAMLEGEVCLKMDVNHPKYDSTLHGNLFSWHSIKSRLRNGSVTKEAYDHWRYTFPADRARELKDSLWPMKRKEMADRLSEIALQMLDESMGDLLEEDDKDTK